jgi:predicted ATPase
VSDADRGVFAVGLAMPGLRRPMGGHKLSDGTLRYLSLIAALLTARPPELLVLNEPETSLHGSLIEPLARLIVDAARNSQVVITTHSSTLAAELAEGTGYAPIVLRRESGATTIGT